MKTLFSKSAWKRKTGVLIASSIVFLGAFGFVIYETTKKTVTLVKNGQESTVKTHAGTVKEFFAEQNFFLDEKDYVHPAVDKKITDGSKIVWKTAKPVQLISPEGEKTIWTTAGTVKELLKNENISLSGHDKVEPELKTKIEENLTIRIEKAFPLTVVDGGKEKEVWTTPVTVGELLKQQGITLGKEDRVEPGADKMISKDTVVRITRVEKVTEVVEEPVAYAVVTKKDSSLGKGVEKVISQGQKGLVKREYEVVKENGKEVSRKLIKETTVKKAKDRVVAVGTMTPVKMASRGTAAKASGKTFYVTATAYTANCNGCSGVTTTGIDLRKNPNAKVIAVDPNVIPLGSKVYVDGYGYAVAADTGGAIKGNRIDVFFPTKEQAYRWGSRKVKVTIID